MLQGKREADWNHTAALIMCIQRSNGNRHASFNNPFAESRVDDRQKWQELKDKIRKKKK